jgi:hypothetical protein
MQISEYSLTMATWTQAIASLGLLVATSVLCYFTKALRDSTRQPMIATIQPQISMHAPSEFVSDSTMATFTVFNMGACDVIKLEAQLSAELVIDSPIAPYFRTIIEDLTVVELGTLSVDKNTHLSFWAHAKRALAIAHATTLEGGQLLKETRIICWLACQHSVTKVMYLQGKEYKIELSPNGDLRLIDRTEKHSQPAFRIMP